MLVLQGFRMSSPKNLLHEHTDLFDELDDAVLCADVQRLDVLNELLLALALHRAAQYQ